MNWIRFFLEKQEVEIPRGDGTSAAWRWDRKVKWRIFKTELGLTRPVRWFRRFDIAFPCGCRRSRLFGADHGTCWDHLLDKFEQGLGMDVTDLRRRL